MLVTGGLLSPAPWTPDSPFYNLKPVCINDPHNQSVTISVPATFTVSGISVPITNVSIPTSGGIGNYPVGLTYLCDPPNCVFNASTLGCILLYGTATAANPAPDTANLVLTATVATAIGSIPVNFPGNQAAPDDHYYMVVKPQGQCISHTTDAGSPFSAVRARPNPASQQTVIEARSTQTGPFQFEVFDLLGNRLHSQTVHLFEGDNQFTFDASNLPAGTYLYTLGDKTGKSVRRMVKM